MDRGACRLSDGYTREHIVPAQAAHQSCQMAPPPARRICARAYADDASVSGRALAVQSDRGVEAVILWQPRLHGHCLRLQLRAKAPRLYRAAMGDTLAVERPAGLQGGVSSELAAEARRAVDALQVTRARRPPAIVHTADRAKHLHIKSSGLANAAGQICVGNLPRRTLRAALLPVVVEARAEESGAGRPAGYARRLLEVRLGAWATRSARRSSLRY